MKRAVITGATSGMGFDLAIALLERGWKLGLAGRNTESLKEIQEKYGPEQVAVQQIDIDQADCTTLLQKLIDRIGGMDSYMHFSGIGWQNPTLDPEHEEATVTTNVLGFTRMVDYAYNWFRHSGLFNLKNKGQIVVVTSVASYRGMGISTSYTSSKKFQSTYVEALTQLANIYKYPVQFTEIQPGFVSTPMLKHPYPCLIPREKALQYILKGVLKRKRLVIFDWRYKIAVFIWKLIPRCLWEKITIIHSKSE